MVNMMHVKGTLVPASRKTIITADIMDLIRLKLDKHEFPGTVSTHRDQKTIAVNTYVEAVKGELPSYATQGGLQLAAVFTFVDALEEALETDTIKELGLNGAFIATVEYEAPPLVVLLTVERQGIFYQQVNLPEAESLLKSYNVSLD